MARATTLHLVILLATDTSGAATTAVWGPTALLDDARRAFARGDLVDSARALQAALDQAPGDLQAWRDLALVKSRIGQRDEAAQILRNLVKLTPNDAELYLRLGHLQLREHPKRAVRLLSRALLLDPDNLPTAVDLGHALEVAGRPERAVRFYRAALGRRPLSFRLALRLGRSMLAAGALDDAVEVLTPLAARDPYKFGPSARSELARLLKEAADGRLAQNKFEEAVALCRSALRWTPAGAPVLLCLGSALQRLGDTAGAASAWAQALEAGAPPSVSVLHALGDAAGAAGDRDRARQRYLQALELAPSDPRAFSRYVEHAGAADLSRVRAALRAVVDKPGLSDAWATRLGDALYQGGLTSSVADIILHTGPNQRQRRAILSRIVSLTAAETYRAGDPGDAIRLARRALALDPTNRQALEDMGWALLAQRRDADARKIWEEYIAAYPSEARPHQLLSQLFRTMHLPRESLAHAQQAAALAPEARVSQINLARAFIAGGDLERAQRVSADLARRAVEDAQAQRLHAEILTLRHLFGAAAEQWQKALALDPTSQWPIARWIEAMYMSGEREQALAEASQQVLASQEPSERLLDLLAQDAELRGDFDTASSWHRAAIHAGGDTPARWLQLIDDYRRGGQPRRLLQASQQALQRWPDNVRLRIAHADALLSNGRAEQALDHFTTLTTEYSENPDALRGRLRALLALRRPAEAVRWWHRSSARLVDQLEANVWEAEAHLAAEDFDSALASLKGITDPPTGSFYVPVLLYHGVGPVARHDTVPVDLLADHLATLARHGYTAITIDDIARIMDGELAPPEQPVVITFDDGRTDSLREADRLLERYNMRATMFVPTGAMTNGSGLHATSQQLRSYVNTGRWDLQGHGHEADGPVAVDERGATGAFLCNRAWLPGEQRTESGAEMQSRLDEDYRQCHESLSALRASDKSAPPRAYAFPRGEFGLRQPGNAPLASERNRQLVRKYFRLAVLQGRSGFNRFKPGERDFRFIVRFEVPTHWRGDRLEEHLAQNHPVRIATALSARALIRAGHLDRARESIAALCAPEPHQPLECHELRARLAWLEHRPRAAQRHADAHRRLAATQQAEAPLARLAHQLSWENEPTTEAHLAGFGDSRGRTVLRQGLRLRFPFDRPLDVAAEMGLSFLSERDVAPLFGRHAAFNAAGRYRGVVHARAWGELQSFGAIQTQAGGARLRLASDVAWLQISSARQPLATARALHAHISQDVLEARGAWLGPSWQLQLRAHHGSLSDANATRGIRATVRVHPFGVNGWHVGTEAQVRHTRRQSREYYSPQGYWSSLVRVGYSLRLLEGSRMSGTVAAGIAEERHAGSRWTAAAQVSAVKALGELFQLVVEGWMQTTPGYDSWRMQLGLRWRPWPAG